MSTFAEIVRKDRKDDFERIQKIHEERSGTPATGNTFLELRNAFVASSLTMFVAMWEKMHNDPSVSKLEKLEILMIMRRLRASSTHIYLHESLDARTFKLHSYISEIQKPSESEAQMIKLGLGPAIQNSITIFKVLEEFFE